MLSRKTVYVSFCSLVLALLAWSSVEAHEVWLETTPSGTVDKAQEVSIYFGHGGRGSKGRSLESQGNKITSKALLPDGKSIDLKITLKEDCFGESVTPKTPGVYQVGAELQTGIIPKPVHSIPANTRIIMYGKTLVQVAGDNSKAGLNNTLGQDLEFVLMTPPEDLKPGGLVKAKLLFKGKPLCEKGVEVSLGTAGPFPLINDPRIRSHQWSASARPDKKYGELAFQLIASGKYLLSVKYYDETPGTYDGDRNDSSNFSHLQKGDKYERTMYITTLSFEVAEK